MPKILRAKYIASEIHAFLFISVLLFYFTSSQPLMDGLSALPFAILFTADLPISFVAFGFLFTSTKWGPVAGLLWGVLGTIWWYGIGYAIDVRIRRYREKRATNAEASSTPTADKIEANGRRKKELLISVGVVAVICVAS